HFYVKKRQQNESGGSRGGGRSQGRSGGGEDAAPQGSDLILRDLREGYDELIGSVQEHAFNKRGTLLAYTVDAAGLDGNGLYLVNLGTSTRRPLDSAKEKYARLTWSEEGDALAVLRGEKPEKKTERANTLVAFTGMDSATPRRHVFDPASGSGLGENSVISEKAALLWSEGLETVFVGTKPQDDELEEWPDDGLPLADVDLWHWADDRIQTVQQRQASRDRNRTYVAAVHLEEGRLVVLADERMRTVDVTRDGHWGIGRDDRDYISDWRPSLSDYYRVDTRTGERALVLEAHLRTLGLSPDSEHFLYWKDGDVWDYEIEADRHVNLTASGSVDFT
ncbi:MAG: hypothetical protein KAJ42_03565, partial [Gemmatimonadetes bacterium]|nr:hypothetical protein [Gemmatimonadota bacterium]